MNFTSLKNTWYQVFFNYFLTKMTIKSFLFRIYEDVCTKKCFKYWVFTNTFEKKMKDFVTRRKFDISLSLCI